MRTIRLNPRHFIAFTAVLALTVSAAFAQEDQGEPKKPEKKEASQTVEEKKAPARKAEKKAPETAKRQPTPNAPRRPHSPDQSRGRTQDLQPLAWLGIAMRDIPDSLREYLELPEGFGVQVDHVAEKSPAAEAGLKVHDILTTLDDQRLISPEHVALLVRSKKKGEKIALSFIRKGKEQTADVTLGEMDLPPFSNAPRGGFGFEFHKPEGQDGRFEFHGNLPFTPGQRDELQRHLDSYQGDLKHWLEKKTGAFRFPQESADRATSPKPIQPKVAPARRPGQLKPVPPLPGKDSGGKPPAISVRPGFPLQLFGAAGIVKIDNPEGEVTITGNDGDHKITIKNKDGETVYDGPYDDEEGTKGLPKEAQAHLKEMKLDDLKLLTTPEPKADSKPKAETKEKKKGEIL